MLYDELIGLLYSHLVLFECRLDRLHVLMFLLREPILIIRHIPLSGSLALNSTLGKHLKVLLQLHLLKFCPFRLIFRALS